MYIGTVEVSSNYETLIGTQDIKNFEFIASHVAATSRRLCADGSYRRAADAPSKKNLRYSDRINWSRSPSRS